MVDMPCSQMVVVWLTSFLACLDPMKHKITGLAHISSRVAVIDEIQTKCSLDEIPPHPDWLLGFFLLSPLGVKLHTFGRFRALERHPRLK
jgi:hypothetical protein